MKKYALNFIKYGFSLILLIAGCITVKQPKYFVASIMELFIIALASNFLISKNKIFRPLTSIAVLLYNAQNLVLMFGGSYILYVMLENTDSLHMLSGRIFTYALGVILVVALSFLPINYVDIKNKKIYLCILAPIILEAIFVFSWGAKFTPACGYVKLYSEWQNHNEMRKQLDDADLEAMEALLFATDEEVKEDSSTATTKQDPLEENELPEEANEETKEEIELIDETTGNQILSVNDNIIVIFTEGLSQSIIDDERGIMPNMKKLSNETIQFTNYFNHTFATYRGIQGQLYSGHQLDNYDVNKLTSIMDVLRNNGYTTACINVEPNNKEFEEYFKRMGFDTVYSTPGYYTGDYDHEILDYYYEMYPDMKAYDMLFNYAMDYKNKGQKFFLVIYTAGTHASFDSLEYKFGDGSDPEINKFYECDASFGEFFNRFKESELAKDTTFILTADHSTYADEMYLKSFSNRLREVGSCDAIPFYVYSKGVNMKVDAAGRNSLDFAPTLLDMLGLKKPSTFLGKSLFTEITEDTQKNTIDYYMWDPGVIAYTGSGDAVLVSEEESANIREQIAAYCKLSTK